MFSGTKKAPASEVLRLPYLFRDMTGKDALTRAFNSLPVFYAMPIISDEFRQLLSCSSILS